MAWFIDTRDIAHRIKLYRGVLLRMLNPNKNMKTQQLQLDQQLHGIEVVHDALTGRKRSDYDQRYRIMTATDTGFLLFRLDTSAICTNEFQHFLSATSTTEATLTKLSLISLQQDRNGGYIPDSDMYTEGVARLQAQYDSEIENLIGTATLTIIDPSVDKIPPTREYHGLVFRDLNGSEIEKAYLRDDREEYNSFVRSLIRDYS